MKKRNSSNLLLIAALGLGGLGAVVALRRTGTLPTFGQPVPDVAAPSAPILGTTSNTLGFGVNLATRYGSLWERYAAQYAGTTVTPSGASRPTLSIDPTPTADVSFGVRLGGL